MSKVKTGTGGSLQNEETGQYSSVPISDNRPNTGKEEEPPLLPNPFCSDFVVLLVLRPCRAPRPTSLRRLTCSLRLCGAHSAARRGTYVSNLAFYLRLFLISLHASPPPFLHHVIACQSQQQFECGSFLGS